jgi:hypothetical protein
MKTTKTVLTGHRQRHHPDANQINGPHHNSQNSISITNKNRPTFQGYAAGSRWLRDQRYARLKCVQLRASARAAGMPIRLGTAHIFVPAPEAIRRV